MELLVLVTAIIISLLNGIETTVRKPCPVEHLKQCVTSLTNLTEATQLLFPAMSDEEFVLTCRNYKENEKCLVPYNRICKRKDRMPISNEENLMEFLCHGRENEYKDFGTECFGSVLLRAEIMICTKSYIGKPEVISAKSTFTEEEKQDFCNLSRDVLYCRYLVMEDHCGTEAARWQHMAHVASLSIPLNRCSCHYTLDVNFEVERVNLRIVFVVTICLLLLCGFPVRMMVCPISKSPGPPTEPLKKTSTTGATERHNTDRNSPRPT